MVSCMKTIIIIPQMAGFYKGVLGMWSAERWAPMDLRRRGQLGPHDGELIVLHMIPMAYLEYYESILENIEAFDGFDSYGHLYAPGGGAGPVAVRRHVEQLL